MQIHSKMRSRLDHKNLHALVYINYNQQLAPTYNIIDEFDPIVLNYIDECTEQLEGQVDDNEDEENDLVSMIPLLIGHLIMKLQALERQEFIQAEKQLIKKVNHQVVVVIGSSHASKKGLGATLA